MAKIFEFSPFELRLGVDEQEFIKFTLNKLSHSE